MGQYQRLLLVADQTLHQTPAMLRAVALAKASGAALDVRVFAEPAPVVHLWEDKIDEVGYQRYLRHHRRWVADQLEQLSEQGLKVTVNVVFTTHALLDILRAVADLKPDLLIKDVTLEPLLKRVFITPLDCHLLRECPVPVHLVNEVRYSLPHRIVAAVDPFDPETQISGLNDTIIQTANALAAQCDAPMHLLYAYDLSPAFNGDAPLIGAGWGVDFVEELRQSLHQAFINLADRYGIPPERRHFVMGLPVPVISEFVEQYLADVVVMGTVHRAGIDRLMGSNTERALYSVPGSILAVGPVVRTEVQSPGSDERSL
ncbi:MULTISPECIES: universal stress protein [Pseudomonas]|uniref:Putative universal stress protein n=1 Tax=Pseudomonas fluorescens (strain Pf0-1) TaxID=205922 RepID=Q3KAX6_PSEPF|nr:MULTISPECIES: universal stress protein [Pseudomonas]ABA75078.1 putative universal stress protein [Pseudomonas fluorescens Pf0-1]MBL0797410.1 universal stress protein [Pseudomonas sp. B7]MBX8620923.1 universal stress protein [Pseudomonas glycinae]MBY9024703.1 universal stress protein [Pseudomonas fluorescens]MBY9030782.1 universal stress protein [Pseudomonas fluorescens]